MAKAVIFLADQFETVEALATFDILKRAGVEVTTVSIGDSTDVISAQKVVVVADKSYEEVDVDEDWDCVILPGGPGHVSFVGNEYVSQVIDKAVKNQKVVAAICAAPAVLGKMGLLEGKDATVFPGYEKYLTGANVLTDKVVVCDNFITGKGMGVSIDFALAIVEKLVSKNKAADIRMSIQMV